MPRRLWHASVLVIVVLLSLPLTAFAAPQPPPIARTYVVKRGDTLADIAWKLGVPAGALGRANGITNLNQIHPGQVLTIPGRAADKTVEEKKSADKNAVKAQTSTVAEETAVVDVEDVAGAPKTPRIDEPEDDEQWACLEPPTQVDAASADEVGDKWIEVSLSEQRLAACEGTTVVLNVLVSTGTEQHPTPIGSFEILDRVRFEDMDGPGYYLEDVPNVMLFKRRGYAIHGTYWHDNFGHPMSHGCINMTIEDSAWLYDWAPDGTPVIVHD